MSLEPEIDRDKLRWIVARAMRRQRRERGFSAKSVSVELGLKSYAVHNMENNLAWIPERVEAYLDWLGYHGDYFALESALFDSPTPEPDGDTDAAFDAADVSLKLDKPVAGDLRVPRLRRGGGETPT